MGVEMMTEDIIPLVEYYNKEIIRLTKENEGRRVHNKHLRELYSKLNADYIELQQENQNLKEQVLLLQEGKFI